MKTKIWILAALLMCALGQVSAAEKVTYYHLDALGSPIAATDANGNLAWKEAYKPYGERIRNEDGGSNSTWYTGKQEDEDNGLTYFGARWYDPAVGRFMGIDPVGVNPGDYRTFNRFAYANNNPYKFVDPDGREVIPRDIRVLESLTAMINNPHTRPTLFAADGLSQKIFIDHFDNIPDSVKGKIRDPAATEAHNREKARNGEGTGSTIYIDPKASMIVDTTHGPLSTPMEIVLEHEMNHAIDNANGRGLSTATDSNYGGVTISERNTRRKENKTRGAMGIPKRNSGPRSRVF